MAYSPNTTNLFRRRALVKFFAGIAAADIAGRAAAAALASTPGCPEADAQLFARWREYLKFGDRTQRCSGCAGPDLLECPASLSTQAGLHRQRLGEGHSIRDRCRHRIKGCHNGHEIGPAACR